jgi:hypothetical protein
MSFESDEWANWTGLLCLYISHKQAFDPDKAPHTYLGICFMSLMIGDGDER